jgi:hypothetical protein
VPLQGVLLVGSKRQEAGGGIGEVQGQDMQVLPCLNKEDNQQFAQSPLFVWNFLGKNKSEQVLCILVLCVCLILPRKL